MYNPNVKLVDLYRGGVLKGKLEYKKTISQQEQDHIGYTWTFVGVKFSYESNPGPEEIAFLQFLTYPETVGDNLTRIDI